MGEVTPLKPPQSSGTPKVRQDFYARIAPGHLAPLWEVLSKLITAEPKSAAVPYRWRYEDVRPYLIEACDLITAEEAERRVLILENPGLPGESKITNTLFGGLQIIKPGEIAHPHRHVQAALRFIIEGDGAYTTVDGERTTMHVGDFIITPNWTWHDHGNPSSKHMVWLDGLDMHMVRFFEASFREGDDGKSAAITKPENDAQYRYGSGVAPLANTHTSLTSPVFNYSYAKTREALFGMGSAGKPDAWSGYAVKYLNPLTGDYAIPTISTHMQLYPQGFETKPYRSTDATVFVCVEGRGQTRVGDAVLDWGPRDIFVVPGWQFHQHRADKDSVLFSYSDRVVQQKLGFWREEKTS